MASQNFWRGKKIVITAGPTREALDPVRYLSNASSGRMGYALADAARKNGAAVVLMIGAHVIRSGLSRYLIDWIRRGWVSVIATNGACAIHDFELRLLPGVMGAEETLEEESFEAGLLEYPHYTRPAEWCGRQVPDVLMSGHHEKIRAWRKLQAERTTESRRPDLWAAYQKRTAHAGQSQKKGRAS